MVPIGNVNPSELGLIGFFVYMLIKDVINPLIGRNGQIARKPWEERLNASIERITNEVSSLTTSVKDSQIVINNFVMAEVQRSTRLEGELSSIKETLTRLEQKLDTPRHAA